MRAKLLSLNPTEALENSGNCGGFRSEQLNEKITLYATAAINGAQEISPNCQQLYPKQATNVEWV